MSAFGEATPDESCTTCLRQSHHETCRHARNAPGGNVHAAVEVLYDREHNTGAIIHGQQRPARNTRHEQHNTTSIRDFVKSHDNKRSLSGFGASSDREGAELHALGISRSSMSVGRPVHDHDAGNCIRADSSTIVNPEQDVRVDDDIYLGGW